MTDFKLKVDLVNAPQSAESEDAVADAPQILEIDLSSGQILFVLGANGSGKTSLMTKLYGQHHQQARRIVSHRQNWFESGAVNITAKQRVQFGENISNRDAQPDSTWREHYSDQRANMAIYDLLEAENARARQIAKEATAKNQSEVERLAAQLSPLGKLNQILQLSNIPVEITIEPGMKMMASRGNGRKYDVAELSDGERNALLIASNVLTAPQGTLLVIDEPERHLHRSIISPLLSLLFDERPDCAFVVSTHDVMLSLDNPDAQKLLVRGCEHDENKRIKWDVDLAPPGDELDDQLMQDVLGARRKIIFVEGTDSSLDLPMYSAIFPSVSVLPKQSCVDVQRAVQGLRSAPDLAWIEVYGVIDGDGRTAEDIQQLKSEGIHAVQAYSIESVYYHPEIQRKIAEAQINIHGCDPEDLLSDAKNSVVNAVSPHIARLAARMVERDVRNEMIKLIPTHRQLADNPHLNVEVDAEPLLIAEQDRLQSACDAEDIEVILCRYPVRETPALAGIASALKFKSRSDYENAVRHLITSDPEALAFVRGLFGTMYEDLN